LNRGAIRLRERENLTVKACCHRAAPVRRASVDCFVIGPPLSYLTLAAHPQNT
jgi:hypothetical protein